MKHPILTILLLLLFVSCKQNTNDLAQYPLEDIKYSIRQYIITEEYGIENINDYTMNIDSIIPFPKYQYLEDEIELSNKVYETIKTEKYDDEYVHRLALQLWQDKLDSLHNVYKNTSKNENYFNCYVRFVYKDDEERKQNHLYILDEKYQAIDDEWILEELEPED